MKATFRYATWYITRMNLKLYFISTIFFFSSAQAELVFQVIEQPVPQRNYASMGFSVASFTVPNKNSTVIVDFGTSFGLEFPTTDRSSIAVSYMLGTATPNNSSYLNNTEYPIFGNELELKIFSKTASKYIFDTAINKYDKMEDYIDYTYYSLVYRYDNQNPLYQNVHFRYGVGGRQSVYLASTSFLSRDWRVGLVFGAGIIGFDFKTGFSIPF